jgi:porin
MKQILIGLLAAGILAASQVMAQTSEAGSEKTVSPRLSTDEVENQITLDRETNPPYESLLFAPIKKWRAGVAEKTGFNWSLDYSAAFMGVNNSPGEDSAGSGMVRFFGFWDLVNRNGPNKGNLNWKIEHRQKFVRSAVQ